MRFRHRRVAAAAALAATAVLGLPACSAVLGGEESLVDAVYLVVGVNLEQPRRGLVTSVGRGGVGGLGGGGGGWVGRGGGRTTVRASGGRL
jgi:glutamate transport system substrate-binding protein